MGSINSFFGALGTLTSLNWWERVGQMILAAIMTISGGMLLLHRSPTNVIDTGGKAALDDAVAA